MSRTVLNKSNVYRGDLILVNARCGLKEQENSDLVPAMGNPDILLQRRSSAALDRLIDRIDGAGDIVPVSGWRSFREQQEIWDDTIKQSGEEFTRKFVALPGHSEHQTGLAIDLGLRSEKIDFICPDFPYDGVCGVFRRLAPEYGFIERYPRGKEAVTGIGHEPWHFRYVGTPHAELMTKMCITLEEYVELLREYVYGRRCLSFGDCCKIAYLPALEDRETVFDFEDGERINISGDNESGFIITKWRGRDGNP